MLPLDEDVVGAGTLGPQREGTPPDDGGWDAMTTQDIFRCNDWFASANFHFFAFCNADERTFTDSADIGRQAKNLFPAAMIEYFDNPKKLSLSLEINHVLIDGSFYGRNKTIT